MSVESSVGIAVESVLGSSHFNDETLGRFAAANQPLVVVLSAGLALSEGLLPMTQQIARVNAQEELFGVNGEGNHALLADRFFAQAICVTDLHRTTTTEAVSVAYECLDEPLALLSLLTAIETWSPRAMPKIEAAMRNLGATDFGYIDAHLVADNPVDGHGASFLDSLEAEPVTSRQLARGLEAFTKLFEAIFVSLEQ